MNWLSRLAAPYRNPAALRMFFLGFSSGLPLLLVLGTLSFRLRECGIDLKTIGFMSWVGLCWGMKWLWAPLVASVGAGGTFGGTDADCVLPSV